MNKFVVITVLVVLMLTSGEGRTSCTSLCPSGGVISEAFVNRQVGKSGETCSELDQQMRSSGIVEGCQVMHYLGVRYCGCDRINPALPLCHICRNIDEMPIDKLYDVTGFQLEGKDANIDGSKVSNCLELAAHQEYNSLFQSLPEACHAFQLTFGHYCGCPVANFRVCRICGSSALLPNPAQTVTFSETCGEIEFTANLDSMRSCGQWGDSYREICCSYDAVTTSPVSSVTVTSSPTPAPTFDPTMMVVMTPAPITASPTIMTKTHAPTKFSPTIMAPAPTAPSSMPSEIPTTHPSAPSAPDSTLLQPIRLNPSQTLNIAHPTNASTSTSPTASPFAETTGQPTVVPTNPGGSLQSPLVSDSPSLSPLPSAAPCPGICTNVHDPSKIVFTTDGGDPINCANLSTISGYNCDVLEYLAVRICGCETTSDEFFCELCEDGSAVPYPWTAIDDAEGTCGSMAVSIRNVKGSLQCSSFQAVAGVYCGCSNPVASNGACRLCYGDSLLPEPDRLIHLTHGDSCSRAEFEANQLLDPNVCTTMQLDHSQICCAPPTAQLSAPPPVPNVRLPTLAPSTDRPSKLLSVEPSSPPVSVAVTDAVQEENPANDSAEANGPASDDGDDSGGAVLSYFWLLVMGGPLSFFLDEILQ